MPVVFSRDAKWSLRFGCLFVRRRCLKNKTKKGKSLNFPWIVLIVRRAFGFTSDYHSQVGRKVSSHGGRLGIRRCRCFRHHRIRHRRQGERLFGER